MSEDKKKRGRPRGSTKANPRTVSPKIRWTADEMEMVRAAAAAEKETISEFVRAATIARCVKPNGKLTGTRPEKQLLK